MTSRIGASTAISDVFIFKAFREMSATVTTYAQIPGKFATSTSNGSTDDSRTCHSSLVDQIGQARLLLSFGLADATIVVRTIVLLFMRDGVSISKDVK